MKFLIQTFENIFKASIWPVTIFLVTMAVFIEVDKYYARSSETGTVADKISLPQIFKVPRNLVDHLKQRGVSSAETDSFAGLSNKSFYGVFSKEERWAYIAATLDSWSYLHSFLDNEDGAWVVTCISSGEVDPVNVEKASALAFGAAAPDRPAVESVFVALMIVCFELGKVEDSGTPI